MWDQPFQFFALRAVNRMQHQVPPVRFYPLAMRAARCGMLGHGRVLSCDGRALGPGALGTSALGPAYHDMPGSQLPTARGGRP